MVRIFIVLVLLSGAAYGQVIGPADRGILDLLYLNEGEQIHGSNIIDGTLTSEKLADGAVTSKKILDGSILDVDISTNAQIEPTKIKGEALSKITVFGGDVTGTWNNLTLVSGLTNDFLTTATEFSGDATGVWSNLTLTNISLDLNGVVSGRWDNLVFPDDMISVSNIAVTDVVFTAVTDRPHQEGLVYYDSDEFALTYFNEEADVGMAIGRELWTRVRNRSGAVITNGYMVYVSGAQGNLPTIELASALDHANSMSLLGMATHDIEDNSIGYITLIGDVKDIDTSAWTNGTALYLSEIDGELTNAIPDRPSHAVRVGVVANSHVSQGIINLKVGEIQEVSSITVHDGDYLGISETNARIVWANSASNRIYVLGGDFGVGTNSPKSEFHVNGFGDVEGDATNDTQIVNYRTMTNEVTSSKGELAITSLSPATQAFTSGGAFEIVTNFIVNIDRKDVDVTTTNITTGAGGLDWEFLLTGSGEKTLGATADLNLHIFTNGVDTGFGMSRSISASGAEGSWAAHGTFSSLPDGTPVDVRAEVSVNITVLFEHLVFSLKEDK